MLLHSSFFKGVYMDAMLYVYHTIVK